VTKLPLARIEAGQVVPTKGRRTMGFAGRAEMLRLWDLMDADQQDQLLLAAAGIVARDDEVALVPVIRTGKRLA
jgi:hypothetical protein